MVNLIHFKEMKQVIQRRKETAAELQGTEDVISEIINDYSLTPAHRRWKLENMLMNVDDQLEQYRKELEVAELTLNALVSAAENEMVRAYGEFEAKARVMTRAVEKLTGAPTQREEEGQG